MPRAYGRQVARAVRMFRLAAAANVGVGRACANQTRGLRYRVGGATVRL